MEQEGRPMTANEMREQRNVLRERIASLEKRLQRNMTMIYVAGKFRADTAWGVEQNIRKAEDASLEIWRMGAAALCPHTNTRFFHGTAPDQVFIDGTLEMLRRCDAMYVCKGWESSSGTKGELDEAKRLSIPTFFQLDDVRAFILDAQDIVKELGRGE